MANRILYTTLTQERNTELAKLDYIVNSMFIVIGSTKDKFTTQNKNINNVRKTVADVVHMVNYDPDLMKLSRQGEEEELEETTNILDKVDSLSNNYL